jgi:hypothetical protein
LKRVYPERIRQFPLGLDHRRDVRLHRVAQHRPNVRDRCERGDADNRHLELWASVLDQLDKGWQTDARLLKKPLRNHYTGPPRGRVTRPDRVYLVLRGGDSPIDTWEQAVIRSFNLQGNRVKPISDEHGQQLPYDVKAVTKLEALW